MLNNDTFSLCQRINATYGFTKRIGRAENVQHGSLNTIVRQKMYRSYEERRVIICIVHILKFETRNEWKKNTTEITQQKSLERNSTKINKRNVLLGWFAKILYEPNTYDLVNITSPWTCVTTCKDTGIRHRSVNVSCLA